MNVQTIEKVNLFSQKNKVKSDVILGDCLNILKKMDNNSVDLVVTSPPYADQRKDTYGGIHPDKYVEWFLPITKELLRLLKPTGTFVLNIKEKTVDGERHTYVMELVMAMRKQGWLWKEIQEKLGKGKSRKIRKTTNKNNVRDDLIWYYYQKP